MDWKRRNKDFIVHGIYGILILCVLLASGLKGCSFLVMDKQTHVETQSIGIN